ncbi:MAG: hypothetical protein RL329_2231 [Bacteroidota bacterium]|jgi:hypothetical protein
MDLFLRSKSVTIAKNTNNGFRIGAVKKRSQVLNPKTETWTKRNAETGQFIAGKADGKPFKSVRKEKSSVKDAENNN